MNKIILNIDIQNFINKNINTDIASILFKKLAFEGVTNQALVEQIEAKKKCLKKLPSWFESANIYYPKKIHIEQTSSEITAQYKAQLVSGKTLLDVTGGLGVDSYFFSKKISQVTHCEISDQLSEIAAHNFKILGAKNIQTETVDGLAFLRSQKKSFEWIFIDPSRRDNSKGKVFQLADCTPNVAEHIDLFFEKSNNILIKTSPLLDISKGIAELKNVFQIHVIALENEVKELLWVLKKGFHEEVTVKTINIRNKHSQKFSFTLKEEKRAVSDFSTPLSYLYEPNAAILKSGSFKSIGNRLSLHKIHPSTHLFTSNKEINSFPGRNFRILAKHAYHKKTFKKLKISKANISTRNFPHSVAEIRKKLKIKDGGDEFLFFTKDLNEKLIVLQCAKLQKRKSTLT